MTPYPPARPSGGVPASGSRLRVALAEYAGAFRFRDELVVTPPPPTMPQTAGVSVRFSRGALRLAGLTALVGFGGYAVLSFIVGLPFAGWTAVLAFIAGRLVRSDQRVLHDEVLAQAIVRAAMTEGRQLPGGRWCLDGPSATALHAELVRLGRGDSISPDAGLVTTPQRQAQLFAEAGSTLRPWLTPALISDAVEEPVEIAAEPAHQPGEPWPVLPHPDQLEQPWPLRQQL